MTAKQSTTAAHRGRPCTFNHDAALNAALDVFWKQGYEPATISELCAAMGINPPSLYAAFGNKAALFLEAARHYEAVYWAPAWQRLAASSSVVAGVERFFDDAADILTAPATPCGCMIVLAAVNTSDGADDVCNTLKTLRSQGVAHFRTLLGKGMASGELRPDTSVDVIAEVLKTLLDGLSIRAHDGASRQDLADIGAQAARMLPLASE